MSIDAPDSTQESLKSPDAQITKNSQPDAQSETRKKQMNADIRTSEQRNNALNGGSTNRADKALLVKFAAN